MCVMTSLAPQFQALTLITRNQWMLHFEAVATVGNDEDAIQLAPQPRNLAH